MEYASKIKIDRKNKKFILNEEAIQSLDVDKDSAKILICAPTKEENGPELALYLINVSKSDIANVTEDNSYIWEIFPKQSIRDVKIIEEEKTGEIIGVIDITNGFEKIVENFDKFIGKDVIETKLVYQENVTGDMKSAKDMYNIKGIYHKIVKPSFKRNIIGRESDKESVEEIINLKNKN